MCLYVFLILPALLVLAHVVQRAARARSVFLGGACNPTTWRADVAIPFLRQTGTDFYNPQVTDWDPSLVRREAEAKARAGVLLFHVTDDTRGTASMVEAAALVATQPRKVVLVMGGDMQPGRVVEGEAIGPQEAKALNRARAYLREVAREHGVFVYGSLEGGLREAVARCR